MASTPLMFAEEDVEGGGKSSIINDFAFNNNVKNASIKIRMGFLRKVYGLLSMQLFMTITVGLVCMFQTTVRTFIHSNDWLLSCAFLMSIIILVALYVKKRDSPANLILLSAFTIVQAYTVGVVLTFYDQVAVLNAFVLTFVIVVGLTLYTFQSQRDFSFLHFGLFAGLCVLIIGGFLQLIIGSSILELVLSIGGAFLFSLFIVYDTQLLMEKLSPEEYIIATINLYLDIINLFLYILRALEAARRA